MIKVLDEKGLERDPISKAIIRTDADALREARNKRHLQRQAIKSSAQVAALEQRVCDLEARVRHLEHVIETKL